MNMRKQIRQLKSYLIDVVGYSIEDLKGLTMTELFEYITNINEYNSFTN